MDYSMFFSDQFTNPYMVAALVLVTGGGLVSRSIAQVTGVRIAPVCFSLGWTAYSLQALADISDHGRLLPSPDSTVKVFNLDRDTGSMRINRSWTIDRLMRDLSLKASRDYPMRGDGMRIFVYEADPRPSDVGATKLGYNHAHLIMAFTIVAQLGIAAASLRLGAESEDWSVMIVTLVGIIAGSCFSSLPQWAAEKLPHHQASKKTFALTAGRGSGDIIVIKGLGRCLDLEELSASRSPLQWSLWDRSQMVPAPKRSPSSSTSGSQGSIQRTTWWNGPVRTKLGRSWWFWFTVTAATVHAVIWLFMLVMIISLKANAWFLLLIAGLGSLANLFIASMELPTSARNVPLTLKEKIITKEVRNGLMDGLMDLEDQFQCGEPLLSEFFPGKLEKDVAKWWGRDGASQDRAPYDRRRTSEAGSRHLPSSVQSDRASNAASSMKAQSLVSPVGMSHTDSMQPGPQRHVEHQYEIQQARDGIIHPSSPRAASSPRLSNSSDRPRPALSSRSSTGGTHEGSVHGKRPMSLGGVKFQRPQGFTTDIEAQRESGFESADNHFLHSGLGIVAEPVPEGDNEEEEDDEDDEAMVSPEWS